jgi:integrase
MPGEAKGNVFQSRGRFFGRVSLGKGKRKAVLLATCATPKEAEARAAVMAELIAKLRGAGQDAFLENTAKQAAELPDAELPRLKKLVDRMCQGLERPEASRLLPIGSMGLTFKEFAEQWTSGELHRRYPDHVKEKRSVGDDIERLTKHVYPQVEDLPLSAFTLEPAMDVMRALPEKLSPATRRHVAQLIHRILELAVFPCRLIAANPLPRGFMPRRLGAKVTAFLYPDEDATLLAAEDVPLAYRLLYGFLAREGCRTSEAAGLAWKDLDLKRGVLTLDRNKTNRPRLWPMDPGVTSALQIWRDLRGDAAKDPSSPVFVDEEGGVLEGSTLSKLADRFRDHLKAAGVDRPQLTEESDHRSPIRAHDLRGTFVTVSLANERSERWVMRRTGHTTSAMLSKYAKHFESAAELNLGTLRPLDQAIPEIAQVAAKNDASGSRHENRDDKQSKKAVGKQQVSRSGGMADAADSKSVIRKGVRVQVPPSALLSSRTR